MRDEYKYRIYHRWLGMGAVDVVNVGEKSKLHLGTDFGAWMKRYRFALDGQAAQVEWLESFGEMTAAAICGDCEVRIAGQKKLLGDHPYYVTDENGPVGVLRQTDKGRLRLRPSDAVHEIGSIEDLILEAAEIPRLGSSYWLIEAPAPLNPLLLAALSLVLRRHTNANHSGRH